MVESLGSQFSVADPLQVPSKLRHTFPQAYRFGLNLIYPLPVVIRFILQAALGYEFSQKISNS